MDSHFCNETLELIIYSQAKTNKIFQAKLKKIYKFIFFVQDKYL